MMTKFPMNCLVPPPSLLLLFIIPDRPLWKPIRALVTTVATTAFMPAVKPTAGLRCGAVAQLGNSANLGISVGGNIGKAVAMTKATPTGIPILATRAAKPSFEVATPHSEVRK